MVAFTRNQARTIDFAASNLRGIPIPLYLAGARIVASYPFGPRAGTAIWGVDPKPVAPPMREGAGRALRCESPPFSPRSS